MIEVEKNRIQVEVMEKMNELKAHHHQASVKSKTTFLSRFLSPFELLKKEETKTRVLLCEDCRILVRLMKKLLEQKGFDVTVTESPAHFLNKKSLEAFDLIITDNHMPYMMGTQFIEFVENELKLNIPMYVYSGDPDLKDRLPLSKVLRGVFEKGYGFESTLQTILFDFNKFQEELKNNIEMKFAMTANTLMA
jgi:CheY-like chemotaxis protein